MRIGIDARMYSQSGIGRYIRNLLNQLEEIDKKNEYFVLLKKEDFDNVDFKKNFQKILADFSWYGVTEQIKLPSILKSLKLDLVHFPHFNVPLFYKGNFVVTIHDLIHQHFNMKRATTHSPFIYKLKQLGYTKIFKNALQRSKKILVPSNYVKNLLTEGWKIRNEKIEVTPEAVDDKMQTIVTKMSTKKIQEMLSDLKIDSPYIFYLGNAHPHKNVEGLIDIFLKLQKKYPDLRLVLSGNDHYFWQKIQKDIMQNGLDEYIRFTGYITDEQAVALYKGAVLFVQPSFEEGFGIPLLEAMSCGCPVVSSNAGSLPEVGGLSDGGAVLYFDPKDKEDFFEKIEKVLLSERLRQDLIKKGKERVKEFSWKALAKKTLEVYESCNSTR